MQRLLHLADVLAAFGIVGFVLMLIVPLPPLLLDTLMVGNICLSLVAILMALKISEPLESSVFPTLLLIATLFRLGLDVSATRMILLHGDLRDPISHLPTGAGHMIPAFGKVCGRRQPGRRRRAGADGPGARDLPGIQQQRQRHQRGGCATTRARYCEPSTSRCACSKNEACSRS